MSVTINLNTCSNYPSPLLSLMTLSLADSESNSPS